MIYQAAQGRLLHNDDTTMKVLELCRQHNAASCEDAPPKAPRKGVFTSGIVSVVDDYRVLFFTGHCHAGENMVKLLKQRQAERQRPIQMCDALSRNMPESLNTLLGNCLPPVSKRSDAGSLDSVPENNTTIIHALCDRPRRWLRFVS